MIDYGDMIRGAAIVGISVLVGTGHFGFATALYLSFAHDWNL